MQGCTALRSYEGEAWPCSAHQTLPRGLHKGGPGTQGDFHHYLLPYRLSFWGDFSAQPRLETIELMCAFCRRGSAVHVFMGVNNRSSDHHGYGLGEQSENPDFSGTLPEILS